MSGSSLSPHPSSLLFVMNRAVILLGSNIDKEVNLPKAVRILRECCRVTAVSPVYETVPVGLLNQPNFFNAAILVETDWNASQIKGRLLSRIEERLYRVRQADKNAPRTIDADLVLVNDEVFDYNCYDGACRHIPDPDLLKFAHVAVPVADILPDMLHPETAETMSAIAARLMAAVPHDQPVPLWQRPDISLNGGKKS
ncbi:MAG: 2-amino-4-hydroxy-6-hydroxymethyldihydropteridine diphosphokinase [Ardenticatenaceae bacterium]|nr:2-amino-4-hydroxy-6-hydroxymethyldihydropteridine diphosphokinase [Ardenticatenaceae bacterium]